jgi:hypothetical protein
VTTWRKLRSGTDPAPSGPPAESAEARVGTRRATVATAEAMQAPTKKGALRTSCKLAELPL